MLTGILSEFYERDIRNLIDEIRQFKNEDNLWKVAGTIKNSAGNLVLHLTGGTNFLIGATLGNSGYVRNRDEEFSVKDIPRESLIAGLEALIETVKKTISNLGPDGLQQKYPIFFDKPDVSVQYVLIQLLAHLNYHMGQINYIRRLLE